MLCAGRYDKLVVLEVRPTFFQGGLYYYIWGRQSPGRLVWNEDLITRRPNLKTCFDILSSVAI